MKHVSLCFTRLILFKREIFRSHSSYTDTGEALASKLDSCVVFGLKVMHLYLVGSGLIMLTLPVGWLIHFAQQHSNGAWWYNAQFCDYTTHMSGGGQVVEQIQALH
jgi:hypothetical protein